MGGEHAVQPGAQGLRCVQQVLAEGQCLGRAAAGGAEGSPPQHVDADFLPSRHRVFPGDCVWTERALESLPLLIRALVPSWGPPHTPAQLYFITPKASAPHTIARGQGLSIRVLGTQTFSTRQVAGAASPPSPCLSPCPVIITRLRL